MKLIKTTFLVFAFTFLLSPFFLNTVFAENANGSVEAKIVSIKNEYQKEYNGNEYTYQELDALILEGEEKDTTVAVINDPANAVNVIKYEIGNKVYLTKSTIGNETRYNITDFVRRPAIYALFIIFALLTFVIAGKKGVYAMLGLAVTFLVLFIFVLPRLINGHEPVTTAILGSLAIIFVSFYLTHGFNKKTSIAVLGTVITLIIVGLVSTFFVAITHLSGYSSDEDSFLSALFPNMINMKDILLASIIISMVGVLDDITISQSAVAFELKDSTPNIKFKELYRKTMNVGKDHIASIVNTLIVVYTSASLPLLLLFLHSGSSFSYVLNQEIVAEEVVRILLASIGLVGAVPITTLLACFVLTRKEKTKKIK